MSRTPNRSEPTIAGWGQLSVPGHEIRSEDLERITEHAVLSRGLGRSYGDSALPPPSERVVTGTVLADRVLSFDPESGLLTGEAGLSLYDLNRIFLARGYFVPVSPGTQFVTLGGMVAADVHGKNHHVDGCFGAHVTELRMRVADGRIVTCSEREHPDLFYATIGGMGLTGHILEVTFPMRRIPSPWIYQETERIPDLDTFIAGLKDAAAKFPFTMGWIDCASRGRNLGRGILFRGRWATPDEAPEKMPAPKRRVTFPFKLPSWALNRLTVRAFNTLYYWKEQPRVKRSIVHPETFFYPLDMMRLWHRMYGSRGFTQYQCILPSSSSNDVARRFLSLLTSRGGASFLCVIKDCGEEGKGLLSFPRPGISIALDIPVRKDTQGLVNALNEFVIGEGGRIYLAKDSFTLPEDFAAMEPRLDAFLAVRQKWDPALRLRSAQSVRLFGDPA